MTTPTIQEQIAALPERPQCKCPDCRYEWRDETKEAQIALLVRALSGAKHPHYYCEDGWYSCPLAEDGCLDPDKSGCTCGASEFNATIDAVLAAVKP